MKRHTVNLIIVTAAMILVCGPPADLKADSGTILSIRRASTEISSLAAKPQSVKLDPVEEKYFAEFGVLLNELSRRLNEIAARAGQTPLRDYTESIQEANRRFSREYLVLQGKISHENRQFTMLSNIMKNRHDTAKNSINNIR